MASMRGKIRVSQTPKTGVSSILVLSGSQTVQAEPVADETETVAKAGPQQAQGLAVGAVLEHHQGPLAAGQRRPMRLSHRLRVGQVPAASDRAYDRIMSLLTLVGNVKILFLCVLAQLRES